MKIGDIFVIFVDKISPDFKTKWTDPSVFPSDLIFKFSEFRKVANYSKIVKPDENTDLSGNKQKFCM